MTGLIVDGNTLIAEPAPHCDELGKLLDRGVGLHDARRNHRDTFSDELGITAIVLLQSTRPAIDRCTGSR
jgi:hypothetical protein